MDTFFIRFFLTKVFWQNFFYRFFFDICSLWQFIFVDQTGVHIGSLCPREERVHKKRKCFGQFIFCFFFEDFFYKIFCDLLTQIFLTDFFTKILFFNFFNKSFSDKFFFTNCFTTFFKLWYFFDKFSLTKLISIRILLTFFGSRNVTNFFYNIFYTELFLSNIFLL